MAISSRKAVVFNVAAVLVAASAVGAVIRSTLLKPSVAPCETRYSNVLSFKLERDGRLLTAIDLQGRAGGRDAGLEQNVEIERIAGAPKPVAMKVRMPAEIGPSSSAIGGMTFPWEPVNIRPHAAACLAYNVLLSEGFDADHDGVLPGFQGAAENGAQHFAISPAWVKSGEAAVAFEIALKRQTNETSSPNPAIAVDPTTTTLTKGRWLRVNQEVVLNAPGAADGIVRMWIDGKLVADRTDVEMRSDDSVVLTGVAVRAHRLHQALQKPAQATGSVTLTPFDLMW